MKRCKEGESGFFRVMKTVGNDATRIGLLSEIVDHRSSLPQTQMPYHYPRPPPAPPLHPGTALPLYHYHYQQFLPFAILRFYREHCHWLRHLKHLTLTKVMGMSVLSHCAQRCQVEVYKSDRTNNG